MATVVINGYVVGFEKVACTKLVREQFDLSLRDGKQVTDDILDGTICRFEVASDDDAARFVIELTKIGALAHVESVS